MSRDDFLPVEKMAVTLVYNFSRMTAFGKSVGLPDSSLEEGAGITEYARHVPDYLVRRAQIDTCPKVGE